MNNGLQKSTDAETKIYRVEAKPKKMKIAGAPVDLLTYNNTFPGPLLEFQEGDRVSVRFKNSLNQTTNLHLHGLPIAPEVDKPHAVILPGEETSYDFTVPEGSAGTYWYHPHLHGQVTRQLFEGLSGPIIIRGKQDGEAPLNQADEKILLLHDISIKNEAVAPHTPMEWGRGKEGERVLINGQLQPRFGAKTGLLRLRLINASAARYYRLQIPGKELNIIGLDGSYLERPISAEELLLSPGERADVLVRVQKAEQLELRNMPYARHPFGPGADTPPEGMLLGWFDVDGLPSSAELPKKLKSVEVIDEKDIEIHKSLTFGAVMQPLQFTINGNAFDHHRTDLHAKAGTTEVWDIHNPMGMDHPFHLHTFPFQVISVNNEPVAYRSWRDVVNVPAHSTVRIAIPFRDYSGSVMYHCHILEHEDHGMMGNLEVTP